jgi:hypothetical protein
VFEPQCTSNAEDLIITNTDSSFTNFRDPFYASTIPQCYALAATTVIAYMLVIMLLITPRTFLHQGAIVLGRRGFTNGPSGSDAGIGIGGRPWLQKVAALTVAISLTIATADTFKVAEQQYNKGIMDALTLQKQVEDGNELKIIRVISDTFLWLAQAQTLIRLFPRQREKIIIKWTAFALISLDVLFSILNNFVYNGNSRPQTFVDAVPALAYLFQLALSLLYCAWVVYYSITKKRFAFYHPQMRNICLVALLSLLSVLVPVVFFVLDISKPTLASWGDYVRWVGAAAASVVVWEWVERIEALERNDKRDGVLGREVFDGDEMLDITPSSDFAYVQRSKKENDTSEDGAGTGDGTATGSRRIKWPAISGIARRYKPRATQDEEAGHNKSGSPRKTEKQSAKTLPPLWPTRPAPAATPVSRTDTASAESTVYAIRYHPISEATPPMRELVRDPSHSPGNSIDAPCSRTLNGEERDETDEIQIFEQTTDNQETDRTPEYHTAWDTLAVANPFRRKVQAPPPEVSAHTAKLVETSTNHSSSNRWDFRSKMQDFAVTQADKLREKSRPITGAEVLPVTVIPAPPRRRNLAATLEEIEEAERNQRQSTPRPDDLHRSVNLSPSHVPEENESPQTVRLNRTTDPYTPTDLNRHSISQRGAISFVTTRQPDRRTADEQRAELSPATSQSVSQPQSPTVSNRSGLPILNISAPPRRPKSDDP